MLNKQGDNIQPWCTPFPIWNQSVVPGPVLTVASWPASRFLKRQVRWSGIPIPFRIFQQFIVIHTVKGFGIVNKAEIDVSLELFCFFHDPENVGNLISSSSAFPECWALSQLFHFLLSVSSRGSLVLLQLSAIRVVSSAYLRLLIFLLAILIPACASSSPAFLMMYSA